MKMITILATDGCLSSSISNMVDTFAIANVWHRTLTKSKDNRFVTKIVTADGNPVTCSNCMQILPQFAFTDAVQSDYLIIPALFPIPDSGSLHNSPTIEFIQQQHASGTTVASICTGSFLLAETGLLNGRQATTNWQFEKKFRFRYPEVDLQIGKILTEQDNIICSGAMSALMHLALRIIRQEGTSKLASACAKAILVDPNNDSQTPYATCQFTENHKDSDILKAERFMRDHLARSISIDQVAEFVCLSPRHFKRRFKNATGESPLNYLQKLRVQSARDRLENSLDNIEEISRCIGYEDSSAFRRLFKRHTSLSPKEYRSRFLMLEER
ncbi:GlxA family transcriptional regulator [Desulfosediminicola sp.]|uniref:GlxA family transcriptional regulator n=1 Tax=Desulfosediminicola sp. TaxID=2886825 RepID=UPI003AF2096F